MKIRFKISGEPVGYELETGEIIFDYPLDNTKRNEARNDIWNLSQH